MRGAPGNEAAAVLLVQSGDREALDFLLRQVEKPLHAYVSRLSGDPETAKDVLQETFTLGVHVKKCTLRALKAIDLSRGGPH